MSNEKCKPSYTANKSLFPKLLCNKSRLRLRFEGSCLEQEDTVPFTPNNIVNLFIVYKLGRWSRDVNTGFTLKDCLLGAVKITKNVDADKCKHSGYSIGFDSRSEFSLLMVARVKISLFLKLI